MRLILARLALPLALLACTATQAKTCLVLSGGGARGIAHVGVIRALEAEHVPVDCIVGTSMGAVIGSLYASGLDAHEIEEAVAAVDWNGVFRDASDRTDRPLRSRLQDRTFLVNAAIGYRDGRFGIPRSLVQGQRLGLVLRGFLLPAAGIEEFDRLATPFRAVATDLESGGTVVLSRGDLATAVRASMAVPAFLPPVEIDGRLLSDGGTASNLPVSIARELGATRIIAVDISAPLRGREKLTSPVTITDQMLTALMRRQTDAEIALLGPGDVLIVPALGDIGSTDFARAATEAMAPGEAATVAQRDRLAAFRAAPEVYATWKDTRRRAVRSLGTVASIDFADDTPASAVLRAYLREHPGDAFDRAELERDIARLYGRGEFESVDYRVVPGPDGDAVRISLRDKQWGDGTLRFGLRLEDNFDGSSNFDLGGRLRATNVNDAGAEWLADAQIGKTTHLGYEWLQPFDARRALWWSPHASYTARNQPLYIDRRRSVELRRQSLEVGIDAGRWLGDWGALSVGAFLRSSEFSARTTLIAIDTDSERSAGLRADFVRDTQDDAQFPRRGNFTDLSLRHYVQAVGGEGNATLFEWRVSQALPVATDDRLLLQFRGQYAGADDLPSDETGFLGGFLDLSGFEEDALFGRHLALGQAVYYRSLGAVFDRYRLFAGGSLEVGNAWEVKDDISIDSLLWGGSVFVAAESPLGALHLGYGQGEGGENSLYLFIGRPY
ncbi:patatin-like phospholipase family protein [Chiayiivirga flava]|uniref:NTE family protein n=1 Tax=Chiayiivirga flava TaxID=659595 RepID=A0A7W8D6E7_9GAMM|nr:patatin-like phospholipase family protein [Chiayiivirga flava]MBB5207542.1 NTE family protein [Chiayiivirga flava]